MDCRFIRILSMYKIKQLAAASLFATALSACGGGGGSDDAPKVQPPPVNQAPTIETIADQSVNEKSTLTITASASDSDGTIASYLWEQTSGIEVTIADADTSAVSFSAQNVIYDQNLTFKLTVSDGELTTSELVKLSTAIT